MAECGNLIQRFGDYYSASKVQKVINEWRALYQILASNEIEQDHKHKRWLHIEL